MSEMCGDVTYQALNAFVLLAVLATLSSMSFPCKAILAGFAIGAACSIKQTAALDGLAVLAILIVRAAPTENRWKGAGAFVTCAAVAPTAFALYFATIGALTFSGKMSLGQRCRDRAPPRIRSASCRASSISRCINSC
jgi:uncharacterized membrane protein